MGIGIRYLLACLRVRCDSVLFAMANYILSFCFLFEDAYGR